MRYFLFFLLAICNMHLTLNGSCLSLGKHKHVSEKNNNHLIY